MMNKYLLGSLLALFTWTGLAQAQAALGIPITPDTSLDANPGPYSPTVMPAPTCGPTCKPKPAHPVLALIGRTMMSPIRAATGHSLPPTCPDAPTKDEVARMVADGGYSPAEIAAAKIKIDEAQIQARRAAVKYLGTIDCHYYPEVELGLVSALRADRAESVRYEAALALGNGRGLTLRMLEALNMTALGVELDGNPAETSERVRIAARMSLYRCACRGLCLPPEAPSVPVRDWAAPEPAIPVSANYHPTVLQTDYKLAPASQKERELAQTISTAPKTAPPASSASRPVLDFLLSLIGRDTRDQRDGMDPRLRGMILLGSETTLAIPTTPPISASPRLPYNNE